MRVSGRFAVMRIVGNLCSRPEKISGSGDVDDLPNHSFGALPEVTYA
jgi:hypothetical protein